MSKDNNSINNTSTGTPTVSDTVANTVSNTVSTTKKSPVKHEPPPGGWGLGGYRPGAGRKPGRNLKISDITQQIWLNTGTPFEEHFARDWEKSTGRERIAYNTMIFSKLIADKVDITVDEGVTVTAKANAFMAALSMLNNGGVAGLPTVPSITHTTGTIIESEGTGTPTVEVPYHQEPGDDSGDTG